MGFILGAILKNTYPKTQSGRSISLNVSAISTIVGFIAGGLIGLSIGSETTYSFDFYYDLVK